MRAKQRIQGNELFLELLKARAHAIHASERNGLDRDYWDAYLDGLNYALITAFGLSSAEIDKLPDWQRINQQQILF